MKFSDISAQRKKYGISQNKIAEYSGFSPATISGWERGTMSPTEAQLDVVSKAVDGLIAAIQSGDMSFKKKRYRKGGAPGNGGSAPSPIKSYDEYLKFGSVYPNHYSEMLESELAQHDLMPSAPTAIALFSGCGGLSLGFRSAGFNIVGHVEIEDSANKIYAANFPETALLGTDTTTLSDNDVSSWMKKYGNIDVIIGGPPCQGFSLAGKRNPEDARSQLYKQYVRIVSILKPKAFILENVRLLTSMKDSDGVLFIDKIKRSFSEIGYRLVLTNVNAQDYGVPQSRERIILVGTPIDSNNSFVFPAPTNMPIGNPPLTFRDATKGLKPVESGESSDDPLHWAVSHPAHVIDWLIDVPEGCSAHDNADPEKRPPSGYNTTYKRIVWDEPCSTISTNFGMISGCRNVHPEQTRSLTVREATRAQSFPDSFAFFGSWGDVRKAIGNAVPPLLAKHVADAVMDQLF